MMTIKRFGAAVGVTAVLAAIPLATLGTESSTTGAVPVAAAAPTTLYPGDPGYDDARQWERDLPSYTAPATATHTVTVTPTTTSTPAPVKSAPHSGGGIPWWVWVMGTIVVLGGLIWWGTTLDDGSSARAARDDDDDDDDDWDDDEDDAPALSYPAITSTPVPEVVPYPEPSAPVQPAAPVAGGSLMDRLGK